MVGANTEVIVTDRSARLLQAQVRAIYGDDPNRYLDDADAACTDGLHCEVHYKFDPAHLAGGWPEAEVGVMPAGIRQTAMVLDSLMLNSGLVRVGV